MYPSFFTEIGDARLHLDADLERLEHALDGLTSHPFGDGPSQWMRVRLYEVSVLRDAIGRVHGDADDPRMALLLRPDGPLADYLRGIVAWSQTIVRAFDELVTGLSSRRPEWSRLHLRLAEGAIFHLQDLVRPIRQESSSLDVPTEHLEELFWGAALLQLTLATRFSAKTNDHVSRIE